MERVGEVCALLNAAVWAFALILFRRMGETTGAAAMNMFKNVVGLALFGATEVVRGIFWGGSGPDVNLHDYVVLIVSGILGIAVADTMFFAGLRRIGVGGVAIVECLYAPLVVLFAWPLLVGTPSGLQLVGTGLVVASVYLAHSAPRAPGQQPELPGVLLCAGSIAIMAFGIVFAKTVLDRVDAMHAAFVRLLAGTVALGVWGGLPAGRQDNPWSGLRPRKTWKIGLPAAVLSTYVAAALWLTGFKYASATVSAALNQTSAAFAVVFARIWLAEPLGTRRILAFVLALVGSLVVTLF